MNPLVVGLSYRTAPVSLLERVATGPELAPDLISSLLSSPHVSEAMVVSTCNRIEVYAGVTAFHPALVDIADQLAARAGVDRDGLADHLYVHYDEDAANHVLRVAAGLDSMVLGEAQILGQLRDAYALAAELGSPGRLLHELVQHALRTGKRVRSETGIDRAGQSVVSAALQLGALRYGTELTGLPALVLGAGAMGALAMSSLRRLPVGELYLANRSLERARRLAAGYDATPVGMDRLGPLLAEVDLVVSATASPGHVLDAALIADAVRQRRAGRPLLLLDLAMPRDVEPAAAELPGVLLLGIEQLTGAMDEVTVSDLRAAERIVAEELANHRAELRSGEVAPTVAALRARADELVAGEMRRLRQRLPGLTEAEQAEVARTVHRVVQRLLHRPSVRMRELASEPGGTRYAHALRELFGLDTDGASAADTLRTEPVEDEA